MLNSPSPAKRKHRLEQLVRAASMNAAPTPPRKFRILALAWLSLSRRREGKTSRSLRTNRVVDRCQSQRRRGLRAHLEQGSVPAWRQSVGPSFQAQREIRALLSISPSTQKHTRSRRSRITQGGYGRVRQELTAQGNPGNRGNHCRAGRQQHHQLSNLNARHDTQSFT
jgi:hypothetical protein